MSKVAHLLLTRFNVRLPFTEGDKNIDENWLGGRLAIFESVCWPAVMAQTRLPQRWLVFFDVRTPGYFKDRLAAMSVEQPVFRPVYCAAFDLAMVQEAVRANLPDSSSWLVTTRLDSDDAVHCDLFAEVFKYILPGRREFLNPTQGLVVAGSRFYRKRDYSSPFISLSEPVSECGTVWLGQHHLLHRYGLVRQVGLRDAWLQIVHGGNVANQIRGVRAPAKSLNPATMPPKLAAGIQCESLSELLLDNSVGLVGRYARSAFRFVRTTLRNLSIAK